MTKKKAEIVEWTNEQADVLRSTVAPGLNENEFKLFAEVCKASGLNPFQRQIHAVMRKGKMVIQTGIDGYRLIASRTKQHAGTSDYQFDNTNAKRPRWARVTVRRIVGGHIAEFTATARWEEYAPQGNKAFMWDKMPFQMLGKCAESQALRRAFPAEMSGMHSDEEMQQADNGTARVVAQPQVTGPVPEACELCGGPMNNYVGKTWPNKKGPDFRCADRQCEGKPIWRYDEWLNDAKRAGYIDVPSTQSETENPNVKQIEAPKEEPPDTGQPDPEWTAQKMHEEGNF